MGLDWENRVANLVINSSNVGTGKKPLDSPYAHMYSLVQKGGDAMGKLKRGYHIILDPDTHERLREIAFNSRTTVSGVVRDAVEEFVRKHEKKPGKKRKGV